MTLRTNQNSLNILDIRLQTDRLILVPVSDEYINEIFTEFSHEITLYMHPRAAQHIGETQEFITSTEDRMRAGKELVCVFLLKDTNEFLGCAGLHDINTTHPELGVWVKKSAHGHKYGREAVTALKQWGDEHVDYEYITYPVARDNPSSRKIAESLGGVIAKESEHTTMAGFTWPYVEYHIAKKL